MDIPLPETAGRLRRAEVCEGDDAGGDHRGDRPVLRLAREGTPKGDANTLRKSEHPRQDEKGEDHAEALKWQRGSGQTRRGGMGRAEPGRWGEQPGGRLPPPPPMLFMYSYYETLGKCEQEERSDRGGLLW